MMHALMDTLSIACAMVPVLVKLTVYTVVKSVRPLQGTCIVKGWWLLKFAKVGVITAPFMADAALLRPPPTIDICAYVWPPRLTLSAVDVPELPYPP
jgi:hypothetical protein